MELADEELLGLMPQQLRDDLATVSRMAAHGAGPDVTPGLFEASLTAGALQFVRVVLAAEAEGPAVPEGREPASVVGEPSDEELLELWQGWNLGWDPQKGTTLMPHPAEYARAVLARYGHQPAPPAEGEVADLIAWLGDEADQYDCIQQSAETSHKLRRAAYLLAHHHPAPPTEGEVGELIERLNLISDGMDALGHEFDSWFVARAADLLEQRHPAPVPVSERLPGPEDCDGERNCWQWIPDINGHYPLGHWELQHRDWVSDPDGDATHWLPSTALPLPAGEVE